MASSRWHGILLRELVAPERRPDISIVSPTFTVSGGAITVLTSYFFARKSQEEARLRQEAEQQRQEEARLRQEAEAQVQTLKAQLERAATPRRRNRRRRALR